MNALLVTALLNCPQVKLIDVSKSWGTSQDVEALDVATKRCLSYYGKEAPCLKVFTKVEDGIYRALCGRQDENNKT